MDIIINRNVLAEIKNIDPGFSLGDKYVVPQGRYAVITVLITASISSGVFTIGNISYQAVQIPAGTVFQVYIKQTSSFAITTALNSGNIRLSIAEYFL